MPFSMRASTENQGEEECHCQGAKKITSPALPRCRAAPSQVRGICGGCWYFSRGTHSPHRIFFVAARPAERTTGPSLRLILFFLFFLRWWYYFSWVEAASDARSYPHKPDIIFYRSSPHVTAATTKGEASCWCTWFMSAAYHVSLDDGPH